LRGQHHRLQAGAAHFVYGQCTDIFGDTATQSGLAGRVLAQSSLDDIAHDHLVHLGWGNTGSLDGCLYGNAAQLNGRHLT